MVTCVAFYSVIFPFRSTFAIKYLQEAQGLSLEQASTLNSYVFLAAALRARRSSACCWTARAAIHMLLVVGSVLLPVSFIVLGVVPGRRRDLHRAARD